MNKGLFNIDLFTEKADDDNIALNDVFNESEIHGSVKVPSTDGPNKHSGPTSNKIEISSDQYNGALEALKKTFNESIEVLSQCIVVEKTVEDKADEALSEAMLNVFEDGPYFEAAGNENKEEIKKIIRKIRSKVVSTLNEHNVGFYQPSKWIRFIASMIPQTVGVSGGIGFNTSDKKRARGGVTTWWNTRFWQIIGACNVEKTEISAVVKFIEEACKEDLGDYKVLYVKMSPTIADLFRNHFGWKNVKNTYFLLVDKSLDKELKKELAKLKPKEDDNTKDDKKED